ncbi:MAG: oleate hydratase, partial [Lachnospiraceae bacterium]|nr:oleate hydratase [Lachnospiraceae bacterium]
MANKKKVGLGVAAIAAGAGAVIAAKNYKNAGKKSAGKKAGVTLRDEYRNTERGKDQKNSKGIYYTNGNYEAFARP